MPDVQDEAAVGEDVKNKGKKDKKDRGYVMFDEEDSEEELVSDNRSKSETKQKKNKPTFKFPKKENKRDNKEAKDKDKKEKNLKSKDNIKEPKHEKEIKEKKFKEKKDKKIDKEEQKKEDDQFIQTLTQKPKWKRKFIVKTQNEDASNIPAEEDKVIFGVPLQIAIERCPCHDGIPLPVVVRLCIDYIAEYGMTCEGIYRISGVKSKVQQLKEAFNNNMQDTMNLIDYEPNVVAGLLKQYLRELPEPVLTNILAPLFEQASAMKNVKEKLEQLVFLIDQLPLANRTLLSWVIVHMTQIIAKEKQNKMSLQNVSIVLSPTMQISHRVLNSLFTYSRILFKDTQIKRYIPPLKPATSRWILELPEGQQELEDELIRQESLLGHLHEELTRVKDEEKEEQLWEVQRIVTQLKRKLKLVKQVESEAHPKTYLTSLHKHTKSEGMQTGTPLSIRSDFHRHSKSPRSSKKSDKSSLGDKTSMYGDDNEKLKSSTSHIQNINEKGDNGTENILKNNDDEIRPIISNLNSMNINRSNVENSYVLKSSQKSNNDNVIMDMSKDVVILNSSENRPEKYICEDKIGINKNLLSRNSSTSSLNKSEKGSNRLETEIYKKNSIIDEQLLKQPIENKSTVDNMIKDNTQLDANSILERKNSEISISTDNSSFAPDTSSIGPDRVSFATSPFGSVGVAYLGDEENDSSDDYTDVCSNDDDEDVDHKNMLKTQIECAYEKLVGDESPSTASLGMLQSLKMECSENQLATNDTTTCSDSSATSDFESEENAREFEKLLKEHTYLMMEEEELISLGNELRQKIATERNETERLEQDLSELQLMREQDAFDSASMTSSSVSITSSSTSADEEDDEKLLEELLQLKEENDNLEHANRELCEKIHQERMICLGVSINIRMLQQKQTEIVDQLTDQESLI